MFNFTVVKNAPSDFHHYASVTLSQLEQVLLHSSVPGFISPWPISGFEHVIKTFANQSLWLSLDYNGDSSWILDGMFAQSLVIIHDGSYMKELLPNNLLSGNYDIRHNCNELQEQLDDVLIGHNSNVLLNTNFLSFVICAKLALCMYIVGTKMRKFPLPVMDMPVRVLGSVRILAHALTGTGNCI